MHGVEHSLSKNPGFSVWPPTPGFTVLGGYPAAEPFSVRHRADSGSHGLAAVSQAKTQHPGFFMSRGAFSGGLFPQISRDLGSTLEDDPHMLLVQHPDAFDQTSHQNIVIICQLEVGLADLLGGCFKLVHCSGIGLVLGLQRDNPFVDLLFFLIQIAELCIQ